MGQRRWRDRPRPPLMETDRLKVGFAIFAGGFWLAAVQGAWAVLTGGPTPAGDRAWRAAFYTIGFAAAAVVATRVVWLYVRRPTDELPAGPDLPTPGDRARDDAERTAWRSR